MVSKGSGIAGEEINRTSSFGPRRWPNHRTAPGSATADARLGFYN
jgi:hypothetical protein